MDIELKKLHHILCMWISAPKSNLCTNEPKTVASHTDKRTHIHNTQSHIRKFIVNSVGWTFEISYSIFFSFDISGCSIEYQKMEIRWSLLLSCAMIIIRQDELASLFRIRSIFSCCAHFILATHFKKNCCILFLFISSNTPSKCSQPNYPFSEIIQFIWIKSKKK